MDQLAVALSGLCITLLLIVVARLARLQRQSAALTRVEGKLDRLLADAGLTFDPYANVPPEVAEAIQRGEKILAIKLYREATGVGLKEAKEYVEEVQRKGGSDA
jgi:ribosomal protein L7/L12